MDIYKDASRGIHGHSLHLDNRPTIIFKIRLVRGICGSGFEESMQLAAGRVEVRIPGEGEKDSGVNAKTIPG